jgi:hypothetical protein
MGTDRNYFENAGAKVDPGTMEFIKSIKKTLAKRGSGFFSEREFFEMAAWIAAGFDLKLNDRRRKQSPIILGSPN